ncbi:MAG TPA: YegS/Rv2252/BmrU family lipid kinase [Gemmatimonadaceae bacterium]|nr:YegS/Rv2252/BmrU family lipid kinase [Gemmatimonadaceae bacterium]
MKCKTAYLIINPGLGKKINALTAIIAVLSAAGWKIDTVIKEYGGHTRRLARKAAAAGYDLVIGFGGDGTLNQVVNGVMAAEQPGCSVGVIPGGTANVWAHEMGMSEDPVKASLLLVNSDERKVDVGYVAIDSFPSGPGKEEQQKEQRQARRGRHHFLLMAGLGIDAAIMRQVPTSLKERIGKLAVALVAVKTLPSQHAFPIEVWASDEGEEKMRWRGEALQVIVGNTRRYGNLGEVTPNALIDDGALDVCIITAGNPLSTIEQILSILLNRNPRNRRSEYFRGSQFWIKAPASIDLQLDGSRVKLDDSAVPERTEHGEAQNREARFVTYRFDAFPRALSVAIPCTYDGELFENGPAKESARGREEERRNQAASRTGERTPSDTPHHDPRALHALLAQGRKVTVVGVGPNPHRNTTYVVAGMVSERKTEASKPVAVRINHNTRLISSTGAELPISYATRLQEKTVIVVEGKQNKRGVIRAKRVVVVS